MNAGNKCIVIKPEERTLLLFETDKEMYDRARHHKPIDVETIFPTELIMIDAGLKQKLSPQAKHPTRTRMRTDRACRHLLEWEVWQSTCDPERYSGSAQPLFKMHAGRMKPCSNAFNNSRLCQAVTAIEDQTLRITRI